MENKYAEVECMIIQDPWLIFFCHAMTCSQRVACHSQNRHLPQDLILCYLESNYLKFEKVKIVVQQSSWL